MPRNINKFYCIMLQRVTRTAANASTALSALMASALLSSCAMGPDFQRPAAPNVDKYTIGPQPQATVGGGMDGGVAGGGAQHFTWQQKIPSDWWTLFHSAALNKMIERAITNNPSLAASQARLVQAAEVLRAQTGATRYPQVDAMASAERQRFTPAAFGFPGAPLTFNLYNASVNASYSFDFFGHDRRELEALRSQVDFSNYQLQGSYLTMTTNIVTAALEIANRNAQIAATKEIIALEEKLLESVNTQLNAGTVALPDVVAQRAELALTRATLPSLEKSLMRAQHQLAVLVGDFPGNAELPTFNLTDFALPQDLPVSLPSELVHQRPDILAAEALLHRASAKIGVATANLYPQVTLSGSLGAIGQDTGDLLSSDGVVWSLTSRLLQPVFHGGALRAQKRAAVAAYDQAWGDYRQTVLFAFQNVADVLQALEIDARALQTQLEAAAVARQSLQLTQQQFEYGAVNYLPLTNAQRALQQSLLGVAQARATRFADTAALFQALGGGWLAHEAAAQETVKDSKTPAK